MCWDRHPFAGRGWWPEHRRTGPVRMTAPPLALAGGVLGGARRELITPLDELVAALEKLVADQQATAPRGLASRPARCCDGQGVTVNGAHIPAAKWPL